MSAGDLGIRTRQSGGKHLAGLSGLLLNDSCKNHVFGPESLPFFPFIVQNHILRFSLFFKDYFISTVPHEVVEELQVQLEFSTRR